MAGHPVAPRITVVLRRRSRSPRRPGGFPSMGVAQKRMIFAREKWMITGGSPYMETPMDDKRQVPHSQKIMVITPKRILIDIDINKSGIVTQDHHPRALDFATVSAPAAPLRRNNWAIPTRSMARRYAGFTHQQPVWGCP